MYIFIYIDILRDSIREINRVLMHGILILNIDIDWYYNH